MIDHFILNLFKSLNKYKINYAILRNYESMPSQPLDVDYFDLDMIVSNKDLKKYNNISYELKSINFLFFKSNIIIIGKKNNL